jgi:hypothetical protein
MYRYQVILSIALLSIMTPSNAEVSVNNIENNDKIIVDIMPVQNGLLGQPSNIEKKVWELHAEQWELARSGESILSLPVLNTLINAWLQDRRKRIEIQYPGGEEGEFWVQELTDWLVSLGIPSNHMTIAPGSGADDMIKLNLIN